MKHKRGGRGRGGKRGGRGNRTEEDRDVSLSKSMSFVLRHGATQIGLQMATDGFLFVEDLLAHQQFHLYTLEDIERVVATNDKQRFKLRSHPEDGRLQIRANQGHSVQAGRLQIKYNLFYVIDLELKPVLAGSPDCPTEAIHGSYLRSWPAIQQQGLSRMKRTHIHLACGLPGEDGVISDGIEFFWSENGVLLTAGDAEGKLLPKYFTRALTLKPTRSILPLAVKAAELQMSEQA
ncbi:tRNA 2'-phosphotransferase 1 isoform X4 [Girardinichthys multiradiatus]|uniref:tRNA 2'-phosphotransferase 1 isoform X4 n=1 Tax=Girardinichthys multiradiatus TaxID=208333 RepID=UPI001FACBAF9|nr:tRNA 2'-phosphotransferase 1 isoform X4 [Girardinichthys multiradiatus]